ncbi:MAG: HTH-type transcriptional activator RhaR [Verrucomicrobiae bacterium]|nr:HTH-type transcriptional activator RhaR [Verrucomicrobiae bacterium]
MRERRRVKFPAFPAKTNAAWLARLLEQHTISGVTAVQYDCAPTWVLEHRRIEDDMFLFVIKGHLFVRVDERAVELRRGDAVHFRRGQWHSAHADPKQKLEIISFHYTATVFESLTLAQLLDFPDVFHLGDELIFQEACRVYALQPAGYRRALEAMAGQLLFRLIHEHGDWLKVAPPESKLADLRRLLPALELIRTELTNPPTINSLAKRCGLSESQFRRVFERTVGVSPVQSQRQARIESACQLLRQTDLTVEAVAAAVGYAEPAFFAHTFKHLIGRPPGEYRRTEGL